MFNDEFRRAALGAMLFFPLLQLPALADTGPEVWTQLETKITVSKQPGWQPQAYRFINESFFGARFPGIGQSLMRMAPMWTPYPGLTVAFNFVTGMQQDDPGEIYQQIRLELEPTVRWSMVGVDFSDRSRVEYRAATIGERWRVRNQLKATFPALNWPATPYVSNEVFYDFSQGAFNQDRLVFGLSHDLTKDLSLDTGYLIRFRLQDTGWERDHVLTLSLGIDLKVGEAALPDTPPSP